MQTSTNLPATKLFSPQLWRNVSAGWRSCAYIKGYSRLAGRKY